MPFTNAALLITIKLKQVSQPARSKAAAPLIVIPADPCWDHGGDFFVPAVITAGKFEGSLIACQSFTVIIVIFREVWRTM